MNECTLRLPELPHQLSTEPGQAQTETKTSKARFIPIHDDLRAAAERSPSDYVFTNRSGRPLTHRIAALFRRTVTKLGIADLHFHDLRHDFATNLRRKGVGLDVIAALLGHTTLAMTQRYAHLGREDLAAAVKGLCGVAKPAVNPTSIGRGAAQNQADG